MKKTLSIIGLVLMCFITSSFALTFSGVDVTTNTSNTTLSFNTPITVSTLELGEDFIYLEDIDTPSCYANTASYNFTGINTTILTSSFYSLFNCAEVNNTLQYDDNISRAILVLMGLFLILTIFSVVNVDEEFKKKIIWFFIAVLATICLKIMFYP